MATFRNSHTADCRWRIPAAVTLIGLALIPPGCSPPQVLSDDECFSTVDALWTAVTARSPTLLDNTAADLQKLRDDGRLSAEGFAALDAIIVQARSGKWEPAAHALKAFIRGQRRQRAL